MAVDNSDPPRKRRSWYQLSAAAFRWVHIYLSMLSFASLMFFAFTGITLNHPTWFGAARQSVRDAKGELPVEVLENVDQLAIAERMRNEHGLRGQVSEFTVDEYECMVVFKGPGYAADVFIDRETRGYTVTETTTGIMAVLNDLHKGRDSGVGWSWLIDVSAGVMILVSLSGFGLIFYLRKRRVSGVTTAVVGTLVLFVVWVFWVP